MDLSLVLISQIKRVSIFWRLITSSTLMMEADSLLNMEYQLNFYVTNNLRSFARVHCCVFFSVHSLIKAVVIAQSEALNGKSMFVS
jgi:hypothetical protein